MIEIDSQGLSLEEYAKRAQETAESRAYHMGYLIPGIMGELGELSGQIAKGYWHQWSAEKLREELTAEYGDVLWMTALLSQRYGVTDQDLDPKELVLLEETPDPALPKYVVLHLVDDFLDVAENCLDPMADFEDEVAYREARDSVARFWSRLCGCCLAVTGRSLGQVQEYNLNKLASRAARGVLRGQGDHR